MKGLVPRRFRIKLCTFASSSRCLFVTAVCLLLSACHPRQERTGPFIEFTKMPRAAEGNPYRLVTIEGRVAGARPGQQIVLYARSGAWWVQPRADQPYTRIQPDSTWKNSTHPGTEYAALLVDPAYRPPAITIVLPGVSGPVAAVVAVKGKPSFWQTWWFRSGAVLALLALAFNSYRMRVRIIEERERQFRKLAENAPDVVMRFDSDLRCGYVNPIVEELMGVPPKMLLGKTNREVGMPETYVQLWEGALRQVFATARTVMKEFALNAPKGQRYFESRLLPEFGPHGSTKSVLAITRDITDRKQAEEKLRRSEAYLAEGQRLAHTASWAWNVRTGDAFWSEEMFRILGYDPETTKPTLSQFLERVHPEDRPRIERRAKMESTALEKLESEADYRVVLANGTIKHLHSIARPVLSESGEVTEVVGTTMDVTERKQAEEERERLRQAQAELAHVTRVTTMGELTASLAHEINQPIAAAITNSNTCLRWLTRDPPDVEEAREAASRIAKDATRAADIIRRVRLLFQKGAPQQELVDVNEVIREMMVLLGSEADRCLASIRADLATDLPKVVADRVQLQQVFTNLMLNGIEAMKDAGTLRELTIKSERASNSHLLISVSDTGVGLAPRQTDEIFNPFYSTKPNGIGMGLAISRSIIESHGGRLWATANNGPGATFNFTLPSEVQVRQ
jgi:PAS domain S-box-containing protein